MKQTEVKLAGLGQEWGLDLSLSPPRWRPWAALQKARAPERGLKATGWKSRKA